MRILLPVALLLALAACKPAEAPPAAPKAAGPAASDWVFGLGENSVELAHLVDGKPDAPDLRLICARGQGFTLIAPRLPHVASEERLSLGAGDEVTALVAARAGGGVQAAGPITRDLLAILASAEPLRFNYGAANAGPFTPPAAVRRVFQETCRKLQAQGQV